jgi:hypothetical protein
MFYRKPWNMWLQKITRLRLHNNILLHATSFMQLVASCKQALKQFFSYPSAVINTNDRAANFNGTDQSHSNAIYENSVVNNNTCSIKDEWNCQTERQSFFERGIWNISGKYIIYVYLDILKNIYVTFFLVIIYTICFDVITFFDASDGTITCCVQFISGLV